MSVIGTPAGQLSRFQSAAGAFVEAAAGATAGAANPVAGWRELRLPLLAVLLVALPVFVQAPLVRLAPMLASLITLPLVALGVLLERHGRGEWQRLGPLLVGFAGSWLGGCLFWGWCRLHPLWHLPLEAFALPLALAGLSGRWRLAGAFYLASLLGTATTDLAIAASGLMPLWPQVLLAPLEQAPLLLSGAAYAVLQPRSLVLVAALAALLIQISWLLWRRGGIARISAATLAATLAVDGVFLVASLLAPHWSGLI